MYALRRVSEDSSRVNRENAIDPRGTLRVSYGVLKPREKITFLLLLYITRYDHVTLIKSVEKR